MADLDDFFAKKDRKKSKTKKFATTDEVAKKLESDITAKKIEKPIKKEKPQEGDDPAAENHQEQDEWKDFEEEKKDYTGLKIGNLTMNSEADGNGTNADNMEQQQPTYDEAGNEVEKKTGPWKRMESGAEPAKAVVEDKVDVAPTPNVVGGAYVPPSKRNAPANQPTLQATRMRSKAAPDIHNEEYFPTLSGTKDGKKGRNEGSFEVVSHNKSNSLRYVEQSKNSGQAQKLSLGNRFNSLSNDS